MADERWIIAGLGNPGPEYAGTRHNAGQMVLTELAARMGARFKAHRTRNDVAEGRLAGQPVTLARPHAYMNLSGGPVAALAAFYKLSPERIVVLHDELDIPFDTMRVKLGGAPTTSLIIHTQPENGKLIDASSQVSYTPNLGYAGKDFFDVQWFGMAWGPYLSNKNIRTKVEVRVRAKADALPERTD